MPLLLHGQQVESVFDLLGQKENGLTYALGWLLSNNHDFLKALLKQITGETHACHEFEVRLQEFEYKDRGYTDIELLTDHELFVIIEAKIGWTLPQQTQIKRYGSRFKAYQNYTRKFVVIGECRKEYAQEALKELNLPFPLEYLSWQQINDLIQEVSEKSSVRVRKLARDFKIYFQKVVTMQNGNSNKVFCVSLTRESFEWVTQNHRYDYPLDKYWPQNPPNYIALRYKGKLHAIHHVDKFDIQKQKGKSPLMILYLGKAFKPVQEVRNGRIYPNGRYWFDLDTVFVCKTIKEARDLTQKREAKA
jgi:hypothetical protein